MKKNTGIIILIVGIGVFFISIIFSTGYNPYKPFFYNIISPEMEIVFSKGKKGSIYKDPYALLDTLYPDLDTVERNLRIRRIEKDKSYQKRLTEEAVNQKIGLEGRIAIPLKYMLSLSIVLILTGVGIILLSKKEKTNV